MYKVLLVEDEEILRKGLRYMFPWEKADCVVVDEAGNGQEGIDKINQIKPDIVVTDVGMPIKTGLEMISETVEQYNYSSIIISVYDEFDLAKSAMHLGVCEYLIKPLDYEQLMFALKRAQKRLDTEWHYDESCSKTDKIMDIDLIASSSSNLKNVHSRRVKKMLSYVTENYNKKIGMSDLVQLLETSSTYLNQKFKQETGFTFNDYLNRYRIQRSIIMMRTGEGKIYTIATDVGFKDYKYFLDVFKKYVGIAPSKFIEYFKQ